MSRSIDDLIQDWDAKIPGEMRRRDIPGLAVGICDADGTIWSACYGTTARDGGTPTTPSTRFSVQSTSKLITATTVLLAVGQQIVDLDAPITEYLPEFTVGSVFDEDPGSLITLRHLLSHTAGFTHEAPVGSNYDVGTGDFDEHCRSIYRTWLRFPVGHHHEYSNLGIDLAGYAVARVAGRTFAQYAADELFAPLRLDRTTFDQAVIAADPDRAIGHWRPFDEIGRPLPVDIPMIPSGGLYTSIDDAVEFVRFQLRGGEPLLTPALAAEQFRIPFTDADQSLGYGLGVFVDEWAGIRVYHHGGSGYGFQAQLGWVPELSVGLVILTNSFDHSLHNELSRELVDRLAPGRDQAGPPAIDVGFGDLGDLGDIAGEYVGRLDDRVEVLIDGDRLVFRDEETHPARVIGPHTIEVDGPGRDRYRFSDGRDGRVAYMRDLRNGRVRYRNDAASTPESRLDPADAGEYTAIRWGAPLTRYELAQDGDSPVLRSADEPDGIALRLAPIDPGLFLSSMGEVLDLRSDPPTYANIPLARASEDSTTR